MEVGEDAAVAESMSPAASPQKRRLVEEEEEVIEEAARAVMGADPTVKAVELQVFVVEVEIEI